MRTLVVNTGSSSVKLQVLEDSVLVAEHVLERWHGEQNSEVGEFIAGAGAIDAVGHRVVHGGSRFTSSVIIDDNVLGYLRTLIDLAPLHEPNALAAINAARLLLPDVTHVACFDTAFHSTMPPAARTYALPAAWNQQWSLRRYGFHGLSHDYVSRQAAQLVGKDRAELRIVSCHLGSGASVCAIRNGISVDTTMGFTPLEGLVMGTRSGSIDPGLLLWLQEHAGLSVDEVSDGVERLGGLAGLSGTSGDMRDVIAADTEASRLALAVYRHRLLACVSAMIASAGGLDLLIFTAGVGEHTPWVRAVLAEDLGFLGVSIDADRNEASSSDAVISAHTSSAEVVVVSTREDLAIESEVRRLLVAPPN